MKKLTCLFLGGDNLKKTFRKSFLVCLSIFSISLFSIFMFAIIRAEITNLSQMNKFYTSSRVEVSFNSTDVNLDLAKKYIKDIAQNNDIIIDLPGASDTELSAGLSKGLYFTEEFGTDFKILKGRILNSDDVKSSEPLAVIGKDFEEYIIKKGDLEYIKLKGKEYKVIGVIGEKNIKNEADHMIFYNLNSIGNEEIFNIVLNSKSISGKDIVKKVEDVIPTKYISAIEEIGEVYSETSLLALIYQAENIIPFVLIIIAFLCTLIRGLIFWVEKISLELGVRLSLGATKINVLTLILKRFSIIYFISSILAILIAIIIQKSGIITIFSMRVDFSAIVLLGTLYIILLITTIVTLCWKVFRLNPKTLIRG